MAQQLPPGNIAKVLIDANLMTRRDTAYRRWVCAIKVDGRVCRNRRNGTRTETKDARNLADHIFRHHRDHPVVAAVIAGYNAS